jgi:hypothetical protein
MVKTGKWTYSTAEKNYEEGLREVSKMRQFCRRKKSNIRNKNIRKLLAIKNMIIFSITVSLSGWSASR